MVGAFLMKEKEGEDHDPLEHSVYAGKAESMEGYGGQVGVSILRM
jgi:hypothetical protein